jgi:CHAT domain-containing protein
LLDTPSDTIIYLFFIIKSELNEPEVFITQKTSESEEEDYMHYVSFTSGKNKSDVDEKSYNNYWEFLADKLIGKSQVFVVADGIYNKINLANLYDCKNHKYLVDNVNFSYLNSVRSLITETPKIKSEIKSAILMGDPSFNRDNLDDSNNTSFVVQRDFQIPLDTLSRGLNITPLPGTKDEINSIEGLLKAKKWTTTVFMNDNATEANIKTINSPYVLHLATHGFFLDDSKLKPVKKVNFDNSVLSSLKPKPTNPLFRSGLLLAGVKNYLADHKRINGEDGILTAYETGFLNLSSTELVVLSACETGRGKILNGEGVYGLRKSVFDAGARNLIISLWKVDDKVTKEFMETFYNQWVSNNTIANAFNNTQKIIKLKYPQPYYWSAFVLVK